MNMTPNLRLEKHQPDLVSIADLQIHIRRAVVENDEISARYLDNLLQDKPLARIAALNVAQNLYDICQRYPEPTIKIIEFNQKPKQLVQLSLWGVS